MNANSGGVTDTSPTAPSTPPSPLASSYPPDRVARVEQEIRALDALSFHEMAQRYRESFRTASPIRAKSWMRKRLVFAIQERAFGSLSERARARLREIQATVGLSLETNGQVVRAQLTRPVRHAGLPAGTELRRIWHGKEECVLVRDDGAFEWNCQLFNTLTATARAISGQRWSGPLFFGLQTRSRNRGS